MGLPVQRIAARRDFIIHYAYLAERAGFETARRFRQAVESTYTELAEMPGLGSPGKVSKVSTRKSACGWSAGSKNI